MLDTKLFGCELKKLGFEFFSGVPCSFLKGLINYAINECEYVAAVNEGDAVSIASGAFIGGKKSVVLMQNSGLTNAVSPLTSLNYIFKIPILGFVSLRGDEGICDEPQHELMGKITLDLLRTIEVNCGYLSDKFEEAKIQLKVANKFIEKNQSFFFVVRKDTFNSETLCKKEKNASSNAITTRRIKEEQFPTRYKALKLINSLKDKKTIQIATTGMTGRELCDIEDAANNLYMVGSMGCACSVGLGLALSKKEKNIVVIDGDGALLMRMGSLAANGYYNPPNMLHILLDNCSYDSTGGQSTVSSNVKFTGIAASCGYIYSLYAHNLSELEFYINQWKKEKKLTFIYMKIAKGSKENIGRPKLKPYEIKERLKVFIDD